MPGETKNRLDYVSIHQEYYAKVRSYLRKLTNSLDAEDLTQEVFNRIHGGLKSLKDPSKLSSWIFTIALNAARDMKRKERAEAQNTGLKVTPGSDGGGPLPDGIIDLSQKPSDEMLARQEMIDCYLGFVKKLPPAYFEIYACSELEDMTDGAISEKLGLPLNTVKMRLHRARQKLYEELRTHCRCYYSKDGELLSYRKK